MEKRSVTSRVNFSFMMGIILLIMGGTAMVNAQGTNGFKAVEGSLVASSKTGSQTIPPIDAAAPSTFETASFGLG
ncbi:MAG: hypothetical protein KJO60_01275 [Desulfofustis sp.]|nr:hypothetical protein [Desulfofustis sp.]